MPDEAQSLRADVRAFVAENLPSRYLPNSDFNEGHCAEFSKKLGARGWIGMTWPIEYGGGGRTFFERYVVTEELLASGARVSAHWIADRQSGPLLLRYGSEAPSPAPLRRSHSCRPATYQRLGPNPEPSVAALIGPHHDVAELDEHAKRRQNSYGLRRPLC